MNASVLWDIVSRAKIEWHEAAGRVAFLSCLTVLKDGHTLEEFRFCLQIVFSFFSSHLEITLLFCLRYFRYCTHAFELQHFLVLHHAVYRSWCVNSHEPIHGNLELEAVIATNDLIDLRW